MLQAAIAGDRDGLALLTEIAQQQLGTRRTQEMLRELPCHTPPALVGDVLTTLYGPHFIAVARDVVLRACEQLTKLGVTPGEDISFSSAGDGRPTLHMRREIHNRLLESVPHGLHLITPFLKVH